MGLGTRAAVDLLGLRDTLLRRAKWGPLLVAMGRTSQVSATGLTPFAFPNVGLFMTFLETNGKLWHSFPNTASKLSLRDDGQWTICAYLGSTAPPPPSAPCGHHNNDQRLGSLKQRTYILSWFWRPDVQKQGVGRALSGSGGCGLPQPCHSDLGLCLHAPSPPCGGSLPHPCR